MSDKKQMKMCCKTINPEMYDAVDEFMKMSFYLSASAGEIYNLIREVGRGELTADNALHQMIEVYRDLKVFSQNASAIAGYLDKKGCAK